MYCRRYYRTRTIVEDRHCFSGQTIVVLLMRIDADCLNFSTILKSHNQETAVVSSSMSYYVRRNEYAETSFT